MVQIQYGGNAGPKQKLVVDPSLVVVRTRSRRSVTRDDMIRLELAPSTRRLLADLEPVVRFPHAGVDVLRLRTARSTGPGIRRTLKADKALQFAGTVLVSPKSGEPAVYTENLFVKFKSELPPSRCRRLLAGYGLQAKRELTYSPNAYFAGAPEGTGQDVFALAARLLQEQDVMLCHPEIVRRSRSRQAFPQQWHLMKTTVAGVVIDANATVEAAWALSQGEGITIALIDDGVDIDHEEFTGPGKIVAPRDVTRGGGDPRPGDGDDHGTACAGVACAGGQHGASGVAPLAKLMPIRLASGLGTQQEADAFAWAADHGADVISCSWGPADGNPSDPSDPLHGEVIPLPDSTRLAIDYATTRGRSGKGCVVTWAAGNGNESVDNDGYASYDKVIAVAACNAKSQRSYYSDFGRAIWCAFPSSDRSSPQTPGIWTTDRVGAAGYNPGRESEGDAAGNYTNSFGGTSSACPGAAGVAALVLARNPGLGWSEVKEVLRRSCERIDPTGGKYDVNGHSGRYGYGRLNAKTAVTIAGEAGAAAPAVSTYRTAHTVIRDVAIEDLKTCSLKLEVGDDAPMRSVLVTVAIDHTYVGDLIVRLRPPGGNGSTPITLHDRAGAGGDNLRRSYDASNTPGLQPLLGKNAKGTWVLEVEDTAAEDTGTIRSWSVELGL
ncbi:MAG: S8 family serine peptidase [Gemmatimonadales bacterium]